MLKFPFFHRTQAESERIASQLQTSRYVRALWAAASAVRRRDPGFLILLAQCAWVNNPDASDESRIRWRNARLAHWAGLEDPPTNDELAAALVKRLKLTPARAKWLVSSDSGITRYYPPLRPAFEKRICTHAKDVAAIFRAAARPEPDTGAKAAAITRRLLALPEIKAPAGGHSSILNGLSPVLACLDPQRRMPIINARTTRLLASFGKEPDAEGAAALSRFIGSRGIRHAFDLDVYAQTRHKRFPRARKAPRLMVQGHRAIGIKAEEDTVALLTKTKLKVRHEHNALTNRFTGALEGKYVPVQSAFDALIQDWKKGRKLLVEAKPSVAGSAGRMQLRLAIGQLYDYRLRHFGNAIDRVDLALLTAAKPDAGALALLAHLGIAALWFEGKDLCGTITLVD